MFAAILMYKITDLLFASRIEEICRKSSTEIKSVQNLDQLDSAMNGKKPALIVCDLVSVKADLASVMRIAKANDSKVLGYYPHIDKNIATFSHSLNVDYVIPRSAFQSKLSSLVLQKNQ